MSHPAIKFSLEDGTNTWIVYVPIDLRHANEQRYIDVERTAGEAFAVFLSSLIEEREAVERHMRKFP